MNKKEEYKKAYGLIRILDKTDKELLELSESGYERDIDEFLEIDNDVIGAAIKSYVLSYPVEPMIEGRYHKIYLLRRLYIIAYGK